MRIGGTPIALGAALAAILPVAVLGAAEAVPVPVPTPEVIVTAGLRGQELATVPASVSVVEAPEIRAGTLQHFEELTLRIPNLNWSGEGSRARYFQIRGTGELAQYEGAPNPSVGFLVDDVDLSGIGGVATLFDTERVEVLRGPQGTRYGANALAGLVYVRTAAPVAEPSLAVTATGGSDDTRSLGAVAGGAVPGSRGTAAWRVALQQYESDGFRNNAFLGRDDTYGRDEFTARLRLGWQAAEDLRLDLSAFHVDLDNGYDAFAIDNGLTTWSDHPGRDAQETDAASLRLTAGFGDVLELVSISTAASSDILLSFDADWGNDAYWSALIGAPSVYDFRDANRRDRDTLSQEFRLVSRPGARLTGADWVLGAYLLRLEEGNVRTAGGECSGGACDPAFLLPFSTVASDYEATTLAFFGELDIPLGERTRLVPGIRWEQRTADYADPLTIQSPRDRMVGGSLALNHRLGDGVTLWARTARGYKAGGFNPSLGGNPDYQDQLAFEPEYLWSFEAGTRAAAGAWSADLALFWQRREDLQIEIPRQLVEGDPSSFLFYTENARRGRTVGAEMELRWRALDSLELYGALGLLRAEIRDLPEKPELEGRDLAHAPRYSWQLGAEWRSPAGWFARADLGGRDRFYIDYCQQAECDDPRLPGYSVLDLRAGRSIGPWTVTAWVRNALDEDYAVRGFWFGNEPPDFAPALYTRQGDPRHAGVTVSWSWQP